MTHKRSNGIIFMCLIKIRGLFWAHILHCAVQTETTWLRWAGDTRREQWGEMAHITTTSRAGKQPNLVFTANKIENLTEWNKVRKLNIDLTFFNLFDTNFCSIAIRDSNFFSDCLILEVEGYFIQFSCLLVVWLLCCR